MLWTDYIYEIWILDGERMEMFLSFYCLFIIWLLFVVCITTYTTYKPCENAVKSHKSMPFVTDWNPILSLRPYV